MNISEFITLINRRYIGLSNHGLFQLKLSIIIITTSYPNQVGVSSMTFIMSIDFLKSHWQYRLMQKNNVAKLYVGCPSWHNPLAREWWDKVPIPSLYGKSFMRWQWMKIIDMVLLHHIWNQLVYGNTTVSAQAKHNYSFFFFSWNHLEKHLFNVSYHQNQL